jgi:hypothetical protein
MPRRQSNHPHARTLIAQLAARLIAEGQDDYHAAKLKAARQLGLDDPKSLPDNLEIESALREHHALFGGERQPAARDALRAVALRAMQWLERNGFTPWLTGPVLTGTANEFSSIELELVGVESKHLEMFLLNDQTPFELTSGNAAALRYALSFEDASLVITLFTDHAARLAAHPRTSTRSERARRAEAEAAFASESDKV